jgi:hypothetical protein
MKSWLLVSEALAAASGEDVNNYAVSAIREIVERREREVAIRAEVQSALSGPARPVAESFAAMREKYGLPDLSLLSEEEGR